MASAQSSRAAEGTPPLESFEVFFEWVEPRLRRGLIAAYGHEAGREACADSLVYAWEHWDEVQRKRNPAGFLYRVGQSSSRRYTRAMPVQEARPQAEPWVEPKLKEALESLTERQRAVVVLVDGYDLSLAETGTTLGLRRSSIQNHLRRARRKLRRSLDLEGDQA